MTVKSTARGVPAEQVDIALPRWGCALRRMLAQAFAALGHAYFDVQLHGIEHFHNRPATLIVANHKSDFDTIVLIPTLYRTHRGRGPISRTRFVAAEQMFQPGYVSTYLLQCQGHRLRRLLYPANLSAVLKALGAYPIPGSRRRQLAAHLHAALDRIGDLPLAHVIRQPIETVFPGAPPGARLRQVLRWRYHDVLDRSQSVSFFEPEIARTLRVAHLTDIETSLAYFAAALHQGYCVFIAPEGTLSIDGEFEGVKAGVGRLAAMADRQVTLLPVNITYDSMTTGRRTVFLSLGREIRGIEQCSREAIEQQTAHAILRLNTITLPQLVAGALENPIHAQPCHVTADELERRIFDQAKNLSRRGFVVDDRLLDQQSFNKRWRQFLRYCRRHDLTRPCDGRISFELDPAASRDAGQHDRLAAWRYPANELHSAMMAADPDPLANPSTALLANPSVVSSAGVSDDSAK